MTFSVASFHQGHYLDATDPATRGGVCVALCDLWLESLFQAPAAAPRHRLQALAVDFGRAEQHQRRYGTLRAALGRNDARRHMGARVGIDYEAQTAVMVMAAHVGRNGMLKKISDDLRTPGAAATWSMRFAGGGGHAIAGFSQLERRPYGFDTRIHVFDPNIGEYVGPYASRAEIIDDLFAKIPLYATTEMFHRTTAAAGR
jgi:hypothetical protein